MGNSPAVARASCHPTLDKRWQRLEIVIKQHQYRPDALIEILHTAQELFGYLDISLLLHIAHALRLPPSQVYGIATFYHFFSLKPKGAHTCVVCMGTACYVKGAAQLLNTLEQASGLKVGETSVDESLSLMTARCLGACGVAPAVVFDDQLEGAQTPESVCDRLKTCLASPT